MGAKQSFVLHWERVGSKDFVSYPSCDLELTAELMAAQILTSKVKNKLLEFLC